MAATVIVSDNCALPGSQADAYNALVSAYRILKDRYNKINTEHQIMSRVVQQVLTEDQMKAFLSLYTQKLSAKSSNMKAHTSIGKQSKGHLPAVSQPVPAPRSVDARDKKLTNQSSDSRPTNQGNTDQIDDSVHVSAVVSAETPKDTMDSNTNTKNIKASKQNGERHQVIIDKGLHAGTKSPECSITNALDEAVERIHTVKPRDDIISLESMLRVLINQSDTQSSILKVTRSMLVQQTAALRKLSAANQRQQLMESMDHRQPLEEDWTMVLPSSS